MDLDAFAQKFESKFGLRRPINEQNISERRALMRRLEDCGKAFSYFVAGLLAVYFICGAADAFKVSLFSFDVYAKAVWLCFFFVFLAVGADCWQLKNDYLTIFQRETFGSARWADLDHLRGKNLVCPNNKSPLPDAIPIATFGWKHWFVLPMQLMLRHVMVVGPIGSGKTASFFTNTIRAWSRVGSAVILDISKNLGEVSRYTSHYFKDVYRFDLVNPECSDRFSLASLRRDPTRAYAAACFMVGLDNNNKASSKEPVWQQSAAALLKCLLLHICEIIENPTPGDVFTFIAEHPYDKEAKVDLLEQALLASPYEEVRESYAAFRRGAGGDQRVSASVFFSMFSPMEPFRDPAVRKVMSMPTEEEAARGCRVIDFDALRTQGTAIYVVVKEGMAERYEAVLGTFFGIAIDVLKGNADRKGACKVLFSLDEAANVPFRNLGDTLATARGRLMAFMLGYQDITQIEKQFGQAAARSLRQNVTTRIFLPGLTDETAEFAVKMLGKTTTFQVSSNDAVGRALDSERLSEVGVDLWDATKLRQMMPYTQAIIVCETAHPVRVGFPPPAAAVDPTESFPVRYDMAYTLTKEAAELYAIALMTPLERVINEVRPELRGHEMGLVRAVAGEVGVVERVVGADPRQAAAMNTWLQLPFAPFRSVVPKALAAPPPAAPAEEAEDDGGEVNANRADEAGAPFAFTDQTDGDAPKDAAQTAAALKALMSQQARAGAAGQTAPPGAPIADPETLLAALDVHDQQEAGADFMP